MLMVLFKSYPVLNFHEGYKISNEVPNRVHV
jgi:hypothetical protein